MNDETKVSAANCPGHRAAKIYRLWTRAASRLRSPFLLAIRLYWGWQFFQTGWGKLQNIPRSRSFFKACISDARRERVDRPPSWKVSADCC